MAARDGSDGSDGKYRMIIANHYKQMADSRESFLSIFRLQLAHALLTVLLLAAQQGAAYAAGVAGPSAAECAAWLVLPLAHVGLALYGRQALKSNAPPAIGSYVVLVLGLASAMIVAAGFVVLFNPSQAHTLAQGAGLVPLVLHYYAPLGLLLLGAGTALASALHCRRFVVALSSTRKRK
jgi:hypothetical protein